MMDKENHPYCSDIPKDRQIKCSICRHCLDDLFFEKGSELLIEMGEKWSSEEDDE